MISYAVPPYQIDSAVIEKVPINYTYGNCFDCQVPDLPKTIVSLPKPEKLECQVVKFNLKDHLTVYFDFNSYELLKEEKEKIEKFIKKLPTPDNIKVIGYTDKIGSKSYNDKLAFLRAQEVAKFLRKKLPNTPIEVVGKGKCCYQSSKDCLNRRVLIIVEKTFFYKPKLEVGK
jgi:outer membrane protein OmpA-like peptidoglycan-associated protein